MTIIILILTILLPPVGVLLGRGAGADLLINIILTLLGWLPGVIHGIWVNYVR